MMTPTDHTVFWAWIKSERPKILQENNDLAVCWEAATAAERDRWRDALREKARLLDRYAGRGIVGADGELSESLAAENEVAAKHLREAATSLSRPAIRPRGEAT